MCFEGLFGLTLAINGSPLALSAEEGISEMGPEWRTLRYVLPQKEIQEGPSFYCSFLRYNSSFTFFKLSR